MRTDFDVEVFLKKCLASAFELDKYISIMAKFKDVDVSEDDDFQKEFNSFYKVRRNAKWRKEYFIYFQEIRDKKPEFREIIEYMYEKTGYVEPSFSSKMLATINPEKPIWDKNVIEYLGFSLPDSIKGEKRLSKAVEIYVEIETWIKNFLDTQEGRDYIAWFNKVLPEYSNSISEVKKVDCYLWKSGEFNRIIGKG